MKKTHLDDHTQSAILYNGKKKHIDTLYQEHQLGQRAIGEVLTAFSGSWGGGNKISHLIKNYPLDQKNKNTVFVFGSHKHVHELLQHQDINDVDVKYLLKSGDDEHLEALGYHHPKYKEMADAELKKRHLW